MDGIRKIVINKLISIENYEMADLINNSEIIIEEPEDFSKDGHCISNAIIKTPPKFYKIVSAENFKRSKDEIQIYDFLEQGCLKENTHIRFLSYELLEVNLINKILENSSIEIHKQIHELEQNLKSNKIGDGNKREIENSIALFNEKKYTSSAKTIAPVMELLLDKLLMGKNLYNRYKSEKFSDKLKVLCDKGHIEMDIFETFKIHNVRNALLHGNISPKLDTLVLPTCITTFIVTNKLIELL